MYIIYDAITDKQKNEKMISAVIKVGSYGSSSTLRCFELARVKPNSPRIQMHQLDG